MKRTFFRIYTLALGSVVFGCLGFNWSLSVRMMKSVNPSGRSRNTVVGCSLGTTKTRLRGQKPHTKVREAHEL
jgi:hypothetical protein